MANGLASAINRPVDPFSTIAGVVSKPTAKERGEAALREMPGMMAGEAQAREEMALGEAQAKREKAQAESVAEERFATGTRQAYEQYQEGLPTRPQAEITAFDPASSLEMAALTAVLGAAMGTVSGRAALKSIEGFTEGYREGREDLYKREVSKFERNLSAWKDEIKMAQEGLTQVVDLLSKDRQAAIVKAKELEPLLQDGVVLAKVRQGNYVEAKKLLDELAKIPAQIETAAAKSTQRQAGSRELLFAQRVYGNIEGVAQDLTNIVQSPGISQSPVFTGLINADPDTMFGSLRSLLARKITKKEEKAFDQIANSISAGLARIEAQGLATGSTRANIAAFDQLRPRAGDDAINMALYLARVKQEIEVGVRVFSTMSGATEQQIANAQQIAANLDQVVPFEVSDVLTVMRNGRQTMDNKMQSLLKMPGTFETLSSPAQAPQPVAPVARRPSAQGKTATMGNVRATARNQGISEEEARQRYIDRGYTISGE